MFSNCAQRKALITSLGKNELPLGVDSNVPELYPGAKVRMYVPWYAAFGQLGTEYIPPYENVIIELELK